MLEWDAMTSSGALPNLGIEPGSPAGSLPSEPAGKPKNTGVGRLVPSPGKLPAPGIKPGSPVLQVDSLPAERPGKPSCVAMKQLLTYLFCQWWATAADQLWPRPSDKLAHCGQAVSSCGSHVLFQDVSGLCSILCLYVSHSFLDYRRLLLLLLLLSHVSRVQLCATPQTAAHQAPPSLGFSRQEHWGCHVLLQCMEVKSESEAAQSCLTLLDPMDCSLLGSSVHGIFQARALEWGAVASSLYLLLTDIWVISSLVNI